MTDADYSTWPTKQEAADRIGVTTKTIERLVQLGQLQQARWRRQGRGPELAVYNPEDVDRAAADRRQGPLPPFVMPTPPAPTNGNGHGTLARAADVAPPPGDDVLRLLFGAALRAVSETSETSTLFLTIDEAAAVSGLSRTYLKRAIAAETLPALKDGRRWRIRRRDLEAL